MESRLEKENWLVKIVKYYIPIMAILLSFLFWLNRQENNYISVRADVDQVKDVPAKISELQGKIDSLGSSVTELKEQVADFKKQVSSDNVTQTDLILKILNILK